MEAEPTIGASTKGPALSEFTVRIAVRGADIDRLAEAIDQIDEMRSPALVRDEEANAVIALFNVEAASLEEASERGIASLRRALDAAEAGPRELATLAVTS